MASLRLCLGAPQVGLGPTPPAWTCNMTCPASGPLCTPLQPRWSATFLVGSREWPQVVGSVRSPPRAWGPLPCPRGALHPAAARSEPAGSTGLCLYSRLILTLRGFGDRPERPTDHEGLRPPEQPAVSPALGRGRSEGQPAVSTALGFLLEVSSPPTTIQDALALALHCEGLWVPLTPASLPPSVNEGAGWSPWCHQLSKTQSTLHRVIAWTLAFLQRRPHHYLLGAQAPAQLMELVGPPCWTPFPSVALLPPP